MSDELLVRAVGLTQVKGTRHRALDEVELDERGPVGDREWCLVDLAARRVVRTVQHPSLVAVLATTGADGLGIELPSGETAVGVPEPTGETLTADYWGRAVDLELVDGPHAALLSTYLGSDLRLAAAPRGGVVFAAPVTIIGTASLRDLADQVGQAVEPARFRATLVVETDEPWAEDSWLAEQFEVGDARLRIGGPIPRCAVIDHHPVTGEKDLRVLSALVAHRPTNGAGEPMFGVYAEVVRPGLVAV